jgi:hypothetical protein
MSKISKSDDARTTMEISTKSIGIIMIGYPKYKVQNAKKNGR